MTTVSKVWCGYWKTAVIILMILSVSGCAVHPKSRDRIEPLSRLDAVLDESGNFSWWYARFKISWPEGQPVNTAMSLLLAHTVIGPILSSHSKALPRWRFHRRAVRDPAGHQFSFIFYSDTMTAQRIFRSINTNPVVEKMQNAGYLETIKLDDPSKPLRPDLKDTSDKRWSAALQKHWPAYIMGVSGFWLGLIGEEVGNVPSVTDTEPEALLGIYKQAEQRIDEIWYREGQHALFHHLNAIFGYEPMLIRKEMRF